MSRKLLLIVHGLVMAGLLAVWSVHGTAGLLRDVYADVTRPRTYQAAVAQVLARRHLALGRPELVAVCPIDSETCLGFHVHFRSGSAPPIYGWVTCRYPGDRCRFSLPAHGLDQIVLASPAPKPRWLRTVRQVIRTVRARTGPVGVAIEP